MAVINDPNVQIPEKAYFVDWAVKIEPESACTMASSPSSDVRSLANQQLAGPLKGKVSCSK